MSNPESSEDRLLSPPEAAEFLGLSESTLSNYRVQRRGPAYIKSGPGVRARVRYRTSALVAYTRTVPTSDQPKGGAS